MSKTTNPYMVILCAIKIRGTSRSLSIIKAIEKLIVGAAINFSQLNQYTCSYIELPSFIFSIGGPADIASTPLQFRA